MQLRIKDSLRLVTTRIHYSFDLWTAPNHRAYLGTVGHWIDESNQLRTALLGLRRFKGAHSGENQAQCFWNIVCEYEVQHLIGKFTMDNATNNDTALQFIRKHLEQIGITDFHPVQNRVRCFGHILNLCVKAFLWGYDVETIEREIGLGDDYQEDLVELLRWRRMGPLGRLHNILIYITRTPQRIDRFEERVRAHNPDETVFIPKIGNITRWSSDYESLERAFRLREPINDFITQSIGLNRDGERDNTEHALKHDELTPDDWDELRIVMDILEPFRRWTKLLQVKHANGCIADILPAMDELLSHLEQAKAQYATRVGSHLVTMINNGWAILDK